MKTTRARRAPNWEVWLKNPGVCQQSLRYFERQAQIRRLDAKQAEADVLGHMKKAFHNLSLANQIFDSNQKNQLQVSYSGENYHDWVITVSYYSMYQACLCAGSRPQVRREPFSNSLRSGLLLCAQEEAALRTIPAISG
jgi:hypothetical protein